MSDGLDRAIPPAAGRRPSRAVVQGLVLDAALAGALAVVAVASTRLASPAVTQATVVLVCLPLVLRRQAPFAVLVVVATGIVLTAASSGVGPWAQIAALALAGYSLGDRDGIGTRSMLATLGIAAAMTLGLLAQDGNPTDSIVLPFVILVPLWLVGGLVRARRVDAEARAAAEERRRADEARRVEEQVAGERQKVARELHDIVAHGVSVMTIQAGAARQVLHEAPDQAETALLAVEATGREAMAELRALLGVLGDGSDGPGLAPQPGVDQLGALVERLRGAGLPADLEVSGRPRPLPAGVDVAAYRIVQEALTNALRYARQARTIVHLAYDPAQLRLEVLDDGPSTPPVEHGSGRGLVGMQERAAQLGGRVEAGPRLGGGYAVRAWLPLEPAAA